MNRILVATFGLLLAVFLLWNTVGPNLFPMHVEASGGLEKATVERNEHVRPLSTDSSIRRGEIIRTEQGGRLMLQMDAPGFLSDGVFWAPQIFLDENTDVRIDAITDEEWSLHVIRGRVYVDMHQDPKSKDTTKVIFTTNETSTALSSGKLSVVNYDFKQTVGIMPMESVVAVVIGEEAGYILQKAIEVHEPDLVVTNIDFDPSTSAAAAFYAWATGTP